MMQAFLFEKGLGGETRKRSIKEYRKGAKERLHTVPGDRRVRPRIYHIQRHPYKGRWGRRVRNGMQDTVMQAFLLEKGLGGETRKRSIKEYRKGAKERLHTVPGDRRVRTRIYT